VGDPRKRFGIVEAWEEMPDLVTANQGEPGIVELVSYCDPEASESRLDC